MKSCKILSKFYLTNNNYRGSMKHGGKQLLENPESL